MKLKQEYKIIITKDGSPTLRLYSPKTEESMHSHGGAFSETIFVYADPFKLDFNKYSILSVGLGLGYNEILSVCEYIKKGSDIDFHLESYEKDEFLIQEFKKWTLNEASSLTKVYDQILNLFAEQYKLDTDIIKNQLLKFIKDKNILLKKSISFTSQFQKPFNILLFDAFCSRTSPELWQENFLQYLLDNTTKKSSFATYACKSALNKILVSNGFSLTAKKGFAGKRESTLAIRN